MTSQPMGRRLVSVLIPAYNAAPTITHTLRSALDQSYPAIEVVVVDDGSQDGTAEVVQEITNADARVRLICQANQGVASARNAALRPSRGSLIAPFDADDLWHRDKIARQVRRLDEEGAHVGVVYCWSSDIDGEGRIIAHRLDLNRYEGDVLAALVVTNFIDNASVPLIRRSELETIGGWDSSLHAREAQGCEDWQLYLRLAQRCNFGLEPAFLVGYRQAPGAMSRNVRRMRKSYRLVMAEVRRSSPALPAKVHRWSQAEFDFYTASLLNQSPVLPASDHIPAPSIGSLGSRGGGG
jgi:glycosyltransferase involved in cell wall biosynthesis